jgi:multidrug efflux pump subunit AcrB
VDYPALRLDVNRDRASQLGLSSKEVINNVITALTSGVMIAPSFWVDPKTGNDYFLTVQYPDNYVKSMLDLQAIPVRSPTQTRSARLETVSHIDHILSPTEVDHYQLRRVIDIYVAPSKEDLGKVMALVNNVIKDTKLPPGARVDVRGSVQGMQSSFKSFGFGLILAVVLVYLILVAQFQSFVDPFIILLAVPPGLIGVAITLMTTDTSLNVMSLMGIVMMVGIVTSNSILIVEFVRQLRLDGMPVQGALVTACRVRLRPILMTSLATLIGLMPMAMKLGTGSEAYAPLARAIIGGLAVSVVLTMFMVPAAYLIIYGRKDRLPPPRDATTSPA